MLGVLNQSPKFGSEIITATCREVNFNLYSFSYCVRYFTGNIKRLKYIYNQFPCSRWKLIVKLGCKGKISGQSTGPRPTHYNQNYKLHQGDCREFRFNIANAKYQNVRTIPVDKCSWNLFFTCASYFLLTRVPS